MKKTIFLLLSFTLFACEDNDPKKENSLEYNFAIIRDYSIDYFIGAYEDSTIFYYDNEQKLKGYDKRMFGQWIQVLVEYEPGRIIHGKGTYFLSNTQRIDSLWKPYYESVKIAGEEYSHADGNLVLYEDYFLDRHIQEYYFYDAGEHVKDSVMNVRSPQPATIHEYVYTDSLKPSFMLHKSGLFEYPSVSAYLIKQV